MSTEPSPTVPPVPASPNAPHPVLAQYYGEEANRRQYLSEHFDASAPDYDWINHVLSFGTGSWYRGQALKRTGITSGWRVVDVACGTGVISAHAVRLVGDSTLVTSVDPSAGMRAQARAKRGLDPVEGTAENLPVSSDLADLVTMGYALRHVSDLDAAFSEFRRVLKPGGRLLVLDITAPASRWGRSLAKLYLKHLIPKIGRLFSRNPATYEIWTYHWDSIEQCVRPQIILAALEKAGFQQVKRKVFFGIFSEYAAQKPPA